MLTNPVNSQDSGFSRDNFFFIWVQYMDAIFLHLSTPSTDNRSTQKSKRKRVNRDENLEYFKLQQNAANLRLAISLVIQNLEFILIKLVVSFLYRK